MRLIALEIQNFRGIKECRIAIPNNRVLCLIGAGDSTKSTMLEAIHLNLLPSWSFNITDADFYQCNTKASIVIRCTYSEFPESLMSEDKYGFYLRSGIAITNSFLTQHDDGSWNDEAKDNDNGCLTVQLTIDDSFEPRWEIICNRLQPKVLGLNDRRLLLCRSIGTDFNSDFTWGRNSILHRYTDGKGELRSAYHEAFQAASQAIHFDTLDSISDAVIAAGKQYSVPIEGTISNKMVMKPNGFTTDVELYDGKAPFLQRGLGSRRLMSIGLNSNAIDGAALLLIDEIETGLEPYRVCELICELKRSHKEIGQVIMTTHCSSAVSELSANELLMVNSKSGITTVHTLDIASAQNIQGVIRKYPEAFLAKRIIVCEGKTEVGFLRALDNYLITKKGFHLAHKGVCPIDGAGGNSAIKLANNLHICGYEVCVLMDSDVKVDNDEKINLRKSGISVIDWDDGNSIEEQLFKDVNKNTAEQLLKIVVDESNIVTNLHRLNEASEICDNIDGQLILRDGLSPEKQRWIGTVAKNVKSGKSKNDTSWFKRIDHGEAIGEVIFTAYDNIVATTKLRKTIAAIIGWVSA